MALETATYIDGLVATNPAASDAINTADDHLRLIKSTIKATFPNITGPVTATQAEINGRAPLASPTFTGTPAAPTASPGTNTTQLATTAFVTAADVAERSSATTLTNKTLTSPIINGSGVVFEGATADDFETTLTVVDPTEDRTITLPNATDTLVCRATTDTLTNKSLALGSNTLTGTKAQFNTAVTDTDITFLNDFTGDNQSLATSGYQKLPGGLIMQWGSVGNGSPGNAGSSTTVTFPITFPTAVCSIQLTPNEVDNSGATSARVLTVSTSSFGWRAYTGGDISAVDRLYWFAVGY